MMKTCANTWCGQAFEITAEDLAFYEKVSPVFNGKKECIPPPTLCPACRSQRRQAWRNERYIYNRESDFSGKKIVSMYSPDKENSVYEQSEWWSDTWDGLAFGREIDLAVSFFQQFSALQKNVPCMSLCNDSKNVNSQYVNQTSYLKNCYLAFDSDYSENLLYTHLGKRSLSCVDCLMIFDSEKCYECFNCSRCYGSLWCQDCENCSDSFFLRDCIGCKNCVGCANLRNAQYCIFNQQYTSDAYDTEVMKLALGTDAGIQAMQLRARDYHREHPCRESHMVQTEVSSGDYLRNAKNSSSCFMCGDIQDCHFCANVHHGAKDCYDYEVWGENAELVYECMTVGENINRVLFSESSWPNLSDILYSRYCVGSSSLFGCIGLRNKKYCILNTQYTKEEYETLVPKIIEKMRADGEWGEFFPPAMSPFGYNETVAQENHPLSKEAVVARGWKWSDYEPPFPVATKTMNAADLPGSIDDVPEDILHWAIACEVTKKPFKIIRQELDFYRQMQLPIPRVHPDERHRRRTTLRNPRTLWQRTCAQCDRPISTSYAPDRPAIVYCERCYLEAVY